MILKESLNSAFNEQITHEMRNVSIYRQIQSFFDGMQLTNIAKYFKNQADHENDHAKMLIEYVNSRIGGNIKIQTIEDPIEITSVEQIANLYLEVEQGTTESIEALYSLAFEEKSFIDLPLISCFLKEQVEEESSAENFKVRVKMVKDLVLFDALFKECE